MKRYHIIEQKREEIVNQFTISSTGSEIADKHMKQVTNHDRFATYAESDNIRELHEYTNLENQQIAFKNTSVSASEYYNKALPSKYANCTSQAIFLCNNLDRAGIESRVFNLAGSHHLVVSLGDHPGQIIASDAWSDGQWVIDFDKEFNSIDDIAHDKEVLYAIGEEICKKDLEIYGAESYQQQLENDRDLLREQLQDPQFQSKELTPQEIDFQVMQSYPEQTTKDAYMEGKFQYTITPVSEFFEPMQEPQPQDEVPMHFLRQHNIDSDPKFNPTNCCPIL
ncbi:MAG: hypothetical protein EP298_01880 [Gammaproteobacteria bacterium]|nr:MAG: hypothetical protein EP298_01880 [Gammaproteobacteria bacterium]UTW41389.1 hypothetical protein KFE69_07650 [bacterium SCSIO 12844]